MVDDAGKALPPGEVGLLRYRGPGVADGYYRDEEASREAFRDGWFYPGDLAARNERGYIFLRGRRKDMILRGGINIYPAEIEATLMLHPAVAEAAVFGIPSVDFGEEIAAFVQFATPSRWTSCVNGARVSSRPTNGPSSSTWSNRCRATAPAR